MPIKPVQVNVVNADGDILETVDDRSDYTAVLAYDGSGNLQTITKTYADGTVSTKTFSYTTGNLTGIDNVIT